MRLTQNWEIRKPGALSPGGIVASQSGIAAAVGAEVLAAGGTAVDAAVATALALAAVEPWNSGLGGIGFMVVHPAGAAHAEAIDFGPVAPRDLHPGAYPLTGETKTELFTWPRVEGDRNIHGPLAFAIPSSVCGYALAVERFGRMPWRELVAPAAALAREGVPVDWFTTVKVANAAVELRLYEESRRIWLPEGLPPICPPERDSMNLQLGRLVDTLERLAVAGPGDFHQGDIAQSIAADVRAAGGVLSAKDLAGCRARLTPALAIPYRDATLQAAPGLTAGPTLAAAIERLARQRFAAAPDAAYFAALADALREAYVDRLDNAGDVETTAPTSTSHITAIDRDGTIAALTTTLLSSFGSRYVLPGTGILMNNGVMWFDPRPARPNSMAPGKRALTNMCPVVAMRGGRPWFG
ncbi:MAG TPA: gamma-glutamyltransferase, partial [Stellaceae bacterium]|nr:gamma-glutamyltransferase [Stellaceae bacterium]